VKKLISIGVALALLAVVIVPGAVAAQCDPADPYYDQLPDTYAKIPFAIVESGFFMLGSLMGDLGPVLDAAGITLPLDLADLTPIFETVGGWAGGPLSWTVDMLGWGVGIVSSLVRALPSDLGIPAWVADAVDAVVCSIFTPYDCVVGDPWDPCP
jgi:hypothetical protein